MQKYLDQLITWRRHLHAHPELSFEEYETSAYIVSEMSKLNNVKRIERLTPTSAVVVFETGRAGAKIGLRADIDALPIQEERDDLPFKSKKDGIMHACGHDGHTAVLMATCAYINDHLDEFSGEIHAIFQHAEEKLPGGAQEMVKTGYFNDFDFIYGHHLFSTSDTGIIDIKDGAASANTDAYNIIIHGKGGHAAMPDQTIDPVIIAAQFITLLQSIVARRVAPHDAMVISNTMIHAGTAQNIIPDEARLTGSVRTTSQAHREFARNAIENLIRTLCENAGARYTLNYEIGYSVTWNNPEKTQIVRELAIKRFGAENVVSLPAMMGGEDFSAFGEVAPACYAFVGSGGNGFNYPHHHPKFGLDEESFINGLHMMLDVAKNSHLFKA